jgi:hypothetical protein
MKVSFRVVAHMDGGHMVEVWDGKEFVAGVYAGERAVKVVSKHPMSTTVEDSPKPEAITIEIGRMQ